MSIRLAIVDINKCRPNDCGGRPCQKKCPVNMQGKKCVDIESLIPAKPSKSAESKATPTREVAKISEELCIGCNICARVCPFGAIKIINIPAKLKDNLFHKFGFNSFQLHNFPIMRPGKVLGILGPNGSGKSTLMKILGNKLIPNLGLLDAEPTDAIEEVLRRVKGTEMHKYFQQLYDGNTKVYIKPQHVEVVGKAVNKTLKEFWSTMEFPDAYLEEFSLAHLLTKQICNLSGGEMQRLSIAIVCARSTRLKDEDTAVFMFDEPSSFLDIKQRIAMVQQIRKLATCHAYVMCIDHDLSVLDYMSDYICCVYGQPSSYGVISLPYTSNEAINHFLDGFFPAENMRIRTYGLEFIQKDKLLDDQGNELVFKPHTLCTYPAVELLLSPGTNRQFQLTLEAAHLIAPEILVVLGENGTGKTTLVKWLAGQLRQFQTNPPNVECPELFISYKPQHINPNSHGTVRQLLQDKVPQVFRMPLKEDLLRPMDLMDLMDNNVQELSGGELQRLSIVVALAKPADIYLLDEPSAYLDVEQRLTAAKVIKKIIYGYKKMCLVVEHDFLMSIYLADRVMVFRGEPGKQCLCSPPMPLVEGMNLFLSTLGVTFRNDQQTHRPRINKLGSVKDQWQKKSGQYFVYAEDVRNADE